MPAVLTKAKAAELEEILKNNPNAAPKALALQFNVTLGTIYLRKANLISRSRFGDKRQPASRPSKVTPAIRAYTKYLIQEDPTLYVNKVTSHIYSEFNVKLSDSTVERMWKGLDISHKKLEVRATQASKVLGIR